MVNFNSPLFRHASAALKASAREAFQRSTTGRLMREAARIKRHGLRYEGPLHRVLKQHKRLKPEEMVRDALGAEFHELVTAVERYSRWPGKQKVIQGFLEAMGPFGRMIRQIVDAAGDRSQLDAELQTAAELLSTHGWGVLPPKPTGKGGTWTKGDLEQMAEFLGTQGFEVTRPGEKPKGKPKRRLPVAERLPEKSSLPFGIPDRTKSGRPRRVVDLPTYGGQKRFPVDHPIVTGAMQPAPQSSNVHSYGYDIENAYLYVRFYHTDQKTGHRTKNPGSMYRYSHVEPELFISMHKAASKGRWIWDKIRIRGTQSGHRKDYELVGIMYDYVPRKATLTPQGEAYIQRRVHVGGGRWLTSQRENELVSEGRSEINTQLAQLRARPNNGRPNGPNRGRPNTGRP